METRGRRSENEQLEEALKRYEDRREEVYKELEIAFVQQKVRSKLLKREMPGVEILFFNDSDVLVEEDLENLVSESAEKGSTDSGSFLSDAELISDKRTSDGSESTEMHEDEHHKEQLPASAKLCEYLDLEAEYSGDENEEESEDQDLSEMIDNTVGDGIELDHFVNEQRENDEKVLEKLRERFIKKKRTAMAHELELLELESNDEFPEIREFSFDRNEVRDGHSSVEDLSLFALADLNKKIKIEQGDIFNNNDAAIQKFSKKDDAKNTGFIEKSNAKYNKSSS